MQNLVCLGAETAIELGDHAVDGDLLDLLVRIGRLEHFLDEGAYAQPGGLIAFILGIEVRLPDDLLKKRARAVTLRNGVLGLIHTDLLYGWSVVSSFSGSPWPWFRQRRRHYPSAF